MMRLHRRLGLVVRCPCLRRVPLEIGFPIITVAFMLNGTANAQLPTAETKESARYIQRERLQLQLQGAIGVFGNCLEQPGKERLTLSGTLKRPNDSQPILARLIWELPNRMRLEEQTSNTLRVTTYDGRTIQKVEGGSTVSAVDNSDETLVATLVYDTPMHFFLGQSEGLATRLLDARVRLDGSQSRDYRGPFYDVYEVHDRINFSGNVRHQLKRYYVNSETLLVERVHYTLERNRSQIPVEVLLSQWNQAQGQRLPGQIVRLENGRPVLTLTITSGTLGPAVDDGIFATP